jgi:hypothetical protein
VNDGPRIAAIVTLRKDLPGGGAPVFPAESEEEREKVARLLAKILRGVVHDLENGVYIVVQH